MNRWLQFRTEAVLLGFASAVLLSACAGMPTGVADEEAATPAAGYGRVFGRLQYTEHGREVRWGQAGFDTSALTLFVRSASTRAMQYMPIEGDGRFYWPLQPGEYVIIGYQIRRTNAAGVITTQTGRLMTAFSVPQAGQAVYVGDLRISADNAKYELTVLDRYADALEPNAARISASGFQPARLLMRPERPIGSYRRQTAICAIEWAIDCDKTYRGVRPLQPVGTEDGFPLVQGLRPALEWKPSSRPGITYDVAIYESLSFMFGLHGGVKELRGTRVAYAEALQEPRYVPEAPLEPGKTYEWTVRLRDGETVSTWSSTRYSWTILVAWSSGSGRGFGFETPPNPAAQVPALQGPGQQQAPIPLQRQPGWPCAVGHC
jgi:hypothetical protein